MSGSVTATTFYNPFNFMGLYAIGNAPCAGQGSGSLTQALNALMRAAQPCVTARNPLFVTEVTPNSSFKFIALKQFL